MKSEMFAVLLAPSVTTVASTCRSCCKPPQPPLLLLLLLTAAPLLPLLVPAHSSDTLRPRQER